MQTTYSENLILNRIFGSVALTPPSIWYIGLSTTAPEEDGTNVTEPTSGSYSRVGVPNTPSQWGWNIASGAVDGKTRNLNPIVFTTASSSWGTITHVLLYDESGNLWFYEELTSSLSVDTGDIVYIITGDLVIENNN